MKPKSFILISIFSFGILFQGCEKEETMAPNKSQKQMKNNTSFNKSNESEVDIELSQFISDIINDNPPSITDVETALLYTESTLYWRLNNPDLIPGETQVYNLEYNLNLSGEELDEMDILQLNNDIYDNLVNIAETADSEEESEGNKFWFEMDVIIPDEISSPLAVQVRAILGFNKSNTNCSMISDWYGYVRGKCGTINQPNKHVTSVLTAKLNDPNCSYSNVEKCTGLMNKIPTGIQGRYSIQNHTPNASFLLDSPNMYACITANHMNTYYLNNTMPSIPWWGDWKRNFSIIGPPNPKKIKSYRVGRLFAYSSYQHEFDVIYYDKCTLVEVQGEDEKPRLEWTLTGDLIIN